MKFFEIWFFSMKFRPTSSLFAISRLSKFGEMRRNLAKYGENWRKIGEKQRNLAKNGEIWRKTAEFGGILAKFGEKLAKCDEVGSGGGPHEIKTMAIIV